MMWQSIGKDVVTFLFCGMSICSLLVSTVPILQPIGIHGKRSGIGSRITSDNNNSSNSSNSYQLLHKVHQLLQVPKSLFGWMYVYGTLAGAICLVMYCQHVNISCLQSLICFEVHCIRRLFECYYMADFGSSTMHVAGLVVGLVHYTLVPLCLLLGGVDSDNQFSPSIVRTMQLLSIVTYTAASALQFHTHAILLAIKQRGRLAKNITAQSTAMRSTTTQYEFPSGGGFEYVACPHYLAEILIYFSWIIPLPFPSSLMHWSMVVWVASNLAVVADSQYRWYAEHFPAQFKHKIDHGWKRLFPKVW